MMKSQVKKIQDNVIMSHGVLYKELNSLSRNDISL